jgi:hypothetical protein
MAIEEPGASAHPEVRSPQDLSALLAQAGDLLRELQALQQGFGTVLEQLAAVDWATLAQQGKLAGIPKFTIERTIVDARNVLANGQQDLTAILRQAQEPIDDLAERVGAMIRLYTDTPTDIRHRCQRLSAWLAQINQALEQRGEPPLPVHLAC